MRADGAARLWCARRTLCWHRMRRMRRASLDFPPDTLRDAQRVVLRRKACGTMSTTMPTTVGATDAPCVTSAPYVACVARDARRSFFPYAPARSHTVRYFFFGWRACGTRGPPCPILRIADGDLRAACRARPGGACNIRRCRQTPGTLFLLFFFESE